MKKEKSPVLVICTMIFLSLFIILPPVFRSFIPKTSNPSSTDTPKLTIVICNKTFSNELYQVNSRTKYIGNMVVNNVITYTKIQDNDTEQTIDSSSNDVEQLIDDTTTVTEELTYFKSIPNLDIVDSNDSIVVTINKKELTDNPNEERLKQYLTSSPNNQKKFYEGLGYSCNIIES